MNYPQIMFLFRLSASVVGNAGNRLPATTPNGWRLSANSPLGDLPPTTDRKELPGKKYPADNRLPATRK